MLTEKNEKTDWNHRIKKKKEEKWGGNISLCQKNS